MHLLPSDTHGQTSSVTEGPRTGAAHEIFKGRFLKKPTLYLKRPTQPFFGRSPWDVTGFSMFLPCFCRLETYVSDSRVYKLSKIGYKKL